MEGVHIHSIPSLKHFPKIGQAGSLLLQSAMWFLFWHTMVVKRLIAAEVAE